MKWLRWFTGNGGERKARGDLLALYGGLAAFADGQPARSGQAVNWNSALGVSVVLACVRAIAEGVAQVPLSVYKPDARGKLLRAPDHPLMALLARRRAPGNGATSFELRETMLMHAALTGNAFAFVNRVGRARQPREIIIIPPGRVTVLRAADGVLTYRIAGLQDTQSGAHADLTRDAGGQTKDFAAEAIWHFRGPSWNNAWGLDVTRLAREAIGLAMATEEHHALMHANGGQTSGLYSVDGTLGPEQYRVLKKFIDTQISGDNRFSTLLLDRGAKYMPTSMRGVDQEHLATRNYQVAEICRAFRVIPMMAGYSDKTATYASAEQMFIAHVVHTLHPWARRFEESAEAALLGPDSDEEIRLDLRGLMRGASRDRAEYFAKALGHGGGHAWMTPNEVREEDGFDWSDDAGAAELPRPALTNPAIAPDDPTPDPAT